MKFNAYCPLDKGGDINALLSDPTTIYYQSLVCAELVSDQSKAVPVTLNMNLPIICGYAVAGFPLYMLENVIGRDATIAFIRRKAAQVMQCGQWIRVHSMNPHITLDHYLQFNSKMNMGDLKIAASEVFSDPELSAVFAAQQYDGVVINRYHNPCYYALKKSAVSLSRAESTEQPTVPKEPVVETQSEKAEESRPLTRAERRALNRQKRQAEEDAKITDEKEE